MNINCLVIIIIQNIICQKQYVIDGVTEEQLKIQCTHLFTYCDQRFTTKKYHSTHRTKIGIYF